jgi:serine/threonine protein kinase
MPGTHERPTKIGKYEILATLGRGGMGVVYKARDPMIDRIVAIKTILVGEEISEDDSLPDRLAMEARSAGRLHHPNIVTVFDFGKEDDLSYIVMEFVEGINLAKLIDERREIDLDTKLSIVSQIANGLAYAHEHGVVHRDMKPSNVCVTSGGSAKILDFGLARFDSTRLTKTGYMAGTIAYMSPERLSGTTGIKDDIFALGAVAYELLTYQRAFPGATPPEVFGKILTPEPPPAPSELSSSIPAAIDHVVLKALAKNADARYESAAQMADDLRQFVKTDVRRTVETNAPTVQRPIRDFVDSRSSGNIYGASSSQTANQSTAIVADHTTKGASTKPDLDLTASSSAPTAIAPAERPRRRAWPVAAALAVIIVAAGVSVMLWRPTAVVKPVPPPAEVKPAPTPAPATVTATPRDPALEQSELQLATARSLSQQLERRNLNAAESIRFGQANARLSLAQQRFDARDYPAGARLASDAITGLQAVINTNDRRVQKSPTVTTNRTPQPRQIAAQPPTQTAVAVPVPQPPARVVETPPAPVPQPAAVPVPVRESPEKEIETFMQQLARAYKDRDVAFFREHSLQFNDQLANAVRRSPSERVELHIVRIDMRDSQHASVSVKRTDWFPDASMPPATRSLVYYLERGAGGWQIASMTRQQ